MAIVVTVTSKASGCMRVGFKRVTENCYRHCSKARRSPPNLASVRVCFIHAPLQLVALPTTSCYATHRQL